MIHDAMVEVTCDDFACHNSILIPLEWEYTANGSAHDGYYDADEHRIGEVLEKEGWTVSDDLHRCPDCA